MPPLHPSLVHFPIALVTLSVIAEFIGAVRSSATARAVAWWSLLAAFLGGGLTIAAGYWDMSRASLLPETHEFVDQHLRIGWALGVCLLLLTLWRGVLRFRGTKTEAPARPVGAGYLTAAALVLLLTFFQAWYGGELAYAHGAGVAAAGQGMVPAEQAKARLAPVHEFLDHVPLLSDEHEHAHAPGEHH